MRVYYFGCWDRPGHYLVTPNGETISYYTNDIPWVEKDGPLCPEDTRKEGIVKIHHKDGWTAAAFWDNSIDHRSGSNSVLFVEGILDITDIISTFKESFPQIYKRFNFELVEWIAPEERIA